MALRKSGGLFLVAASIMCALPGGVIGSQEHNHTDAPPSAFQPSERPNRAILTRGQVSRIERAQRDVDQLNRKLREARQRLQSMQLTAMRAAVQTANPNVTAAAITFMSGPNEFCFDDVVAGYEIGDVVVYGRGGANGALVITGTGNVFQVDADGVGAHTTASVDEFEPRLGDRVFVVSRADSPCSLSKYFKQRLLMSARIGVQLYNRKFKT